MRAIPRFVRVRNPRPDNPEHRRHRDDIARARAGVPLDPSHQLR